MMADNRYTLTTTTTATATTKTTTTTISDVNYPEVMKYVHV